MKRLILVAAVCGLAACSPKTQEPAPVEAPAASSDASVPAASEAASPALQTSSFTGRWTGVEGTYLNITPKSGADYEVVIADLDGPKTYAGVLKADGLHVDRNGQALIIVPGSGDDTGMKWLAGKTDCLVVAANEGYCRD
ncbi:MAG: hypothetical protein QM667_01165 [Asticcacaulis sp.]